MALSKPVRWSLIRAAAMALCAGIAATVLWCRMIRMPGKSLRGPLPAWTEAEKQTAARLGKDLHTLAVEIGERHVFAMAKLDQAAAFVDAELRAAGYTVEAQVFTARGESCRNLEVEIPGSSSRARIVVVGAHYDSVYGCPGANDNGTGVVALLELARRFAGHPQPRTLRFVAFANEEPPFFQSPEMGSLMYATRCREGGEQITAMLSLETIGCFSDLPGSQRYPFPFGHFYPDTGNFIAFVGNTRSASLVRQTLARFRRCANFPSEGVATFGGLPGIGWSDHWAFWQQDYPAIMLTDTAPFRYRHYHGNGDLPKEVDCLRLARIVGNLQDVLTDLCQGER